MSNTNSTSGGIGLTGLLTIVFVVLKLTNIIDWSWWWVLSPTIAAVSAWILVVAIAIILKIKYP